MNKKIVAASALLLTTLISSCAWLGLGSSDNPTRTVASLKKEAEEFGGSDVFHDEEAFSTRQRVNCSLTGRGPNEFVKPFQFYFDLEQLHSSSWTERVSVGHGLEVYVNLWSFREYTLGLKNTRGLASDARLAETKGVWSHGREKTITDLSKVRFQTKLFYSAEGQSYEISCPGND